VQVMRYADMYDIQFVGYSEMSLMK
jgi:hypothetical protein